MNKQIIIEYNNKEYTLEFNRASVMRLEMLGFDISKASERPLNSISLLFYGAFLMNQPHTKKELTDEILSTMKNVKALFEKLIEMYNEPLKFLSDEDDEGNAGWEATF